jgi:hypothetical protein
VSISVADAKHCKSRDSCPYCHAYRGFYHADDCRVSLPFSAPRHVIVGDEPLADPPIVCLPLMRLPSEPVDKKTTLHMKDLLARTLAWMREW